MAEEKEQVITVISENPPKKSAGERIRKILMWVFFPVGIFTLFWKKLSKYFRLNITAKTTILYTILFVISVGAYIAFVVSTVLGDDGSGRLAESIVVGTVIIASVSFVIFVTFGSIASQMMLSPIKKIISQVDEVTANNMSKRVDKVDSQDELNELTTQINKMLSELEESFSRQANFVSDASHELRTPIAVIQGYSDLLDRWGKTDPAILEEAIAAIKTESGNMQSITDRLLYLTKLGSFKPTLSDFSLSEIVRDLVAGYRLTSSGKEVSASIDDDTYVESDKQLIIELLRIIVDNAIKYTGEGGKIKISLSRERKTARLVIEDNGIGISDEDLPHIFDRFYRCDKARGREQGSTGLGLAIAKSIAETLGLTIEVKSKLKKGTVFTIRIPYDSLVGEKQLRSLKKPGRQ